MSRVRGWGRDFIWSLQKRLRACSGSGKDPPTGSNANGARAIRKPKTYFEIRRLSRGGWAFTF